MMGFIRKLGTFAFLVVLSFQSALAGNEHEHLQYLPRLEDIEAAYDGKLGEIPALDLFSNPAHLNDKFGHLITNDELREMVKKVNIKNLCADISKRIPGTTPQGILEAIFEMRELGGDPRRSYLASNTIRDELFRKDPEKIVKAVENYLKTTNFHEINKSIFTVPDYFVDHKIIFKLKQMYYQRGMQAEFLYSIRRSTMEKPKFEESIIKAKSMFGRTRSTRILDGIDISGSVYESDIKDTFNDKSLAKLTERFKSIFKDSKLNKTSIRIHAFELANSGNFYKAFFDALADCKKKACSPRILRIGHINKLDEESILKIKKSRGLTEVIFEANIESNMRIHGAKIDNLVKTIETIHRHGMPVVLGSDGRGILGKQSGMMETLEALKNAGMKRSSLRALIDDALIPLYADDSIIKKDQVLIEWRQQIREKILGDKGQGFLDYCKLEFIQRIKKIFR